MSDSAVSHRAHSMGPAVQAGLFAVLIGLLAQIWAHQHRMIFAFWDAQAHLDIARRLHDSLTPGLQMLGTVWLPVPHLLLFPFTLVDRWWWNGTAGGIVGLISLGVSAAFLHDLLARRCRDQRLAWLGTAFLIFNPSLLLLQSTAMTEPVLLAALISGAALLDRWDESGSRSTLRWAGIALALAVGTRYDGWFALLLALPWVLFKASRTRRPIFSSLLNFAVPAAVMTALWLGYNAWFFGDPLEFQRGIWSAQSQQNELAGSGLLPTRGRLDTSLLAYAGAVILSSGAWLTLGAVTLILACRGRIGATGAMLLLLAALPFNVLALWSGQSTIGMPWTEHGSTANLRYGIMLLPGLAAVVALGADHLGRKMSQPRGMFFALLLLTGAQLALWAWHWPAQVGVVREAVAIRDGDLRQQLASDWLAGHYDGGRILVDEALNLSPRTRIAIRDRIYIWTWELGPRALALPEREVDWVMVDRHHLNGEVAKSIAASPSFLIRFERTFEDDGLEIWRRR